MDVIVRTEEEWLHFRGMSKLLPSSMRIKQHIYNKYQEGEHKRKRQSKQQGKEAKRDECNVQWVHGWTRWLLTDAGYK